MFHVDAKRIFDVLISAILLLVALPVILGIALISTVSLRSWPFFVQDRIGQGGRTFRFLKIRTLPTTFATYAAKSALEEVAISGPMRALRATHLDELPQLWLVLTGRMSLVGPRPEMEMLHERLAPTVASERVSVRPGVTGLWQVSTHCDGLISDRVEYDRLYVRYSNARLDLWIMAKTVEKMLFGRRVHLFEVPTWAISHERTIPVGPQRVPALAATASAPAFVDRRVPPGVALAD